MTTTTTENGTTPATSGAAFSDIEALAEDIEKLEVLLSQPELSASDDADVAELLKRLDRADGMADNLELKLDGILEKLDGILGSMDVEATAEEVVVVVEVSEDVANGDN
ncbi:hypothetical protein D9615_001036 [Tricholomella constricta]|uniref:Uncharacterized protein n=1 Tax=Tricholomella constricta TaxID=117010 RepID=A0A8H5HLG9_9AGAR|nr:hypothetical protein D9615_001036 [Tricholomella constricta]